MFTYEERIRALQMYAQNKSVKKTIRMLGYPGRQTLYKWIEEQETPGREKSTFRGINTPEHPRHPSVELKLEALHRCFELGEDVESVSVEIGWSIVYNTSALTADYCFRENFDKEYSAMLLDKGGWMYIHND